MKTAGIPARTCFPFLRHSVLAAGCLLGLASCRAPYDHVQLILERHREAVRRLPEEDRELLSRYGPPVVTEDAAELLPPETLELGQARAIAVRANPDIHAARARFQAAAARIVDARSRYFPVVAVTQTSTRTFHTPASRNRLNLVVQPPQTTPVDIEDTQITLTTLINALRRPFFGGGTEFRGDRNSFSEHSLAFTATWTVFDGFIREAQLLSTKYLFRAATMSLADVERLIVQAVDQAYYSVQLAEERVRITRADEEFSRNQLEETEKLLQAGRASQTDVDNFRVRMLTAQANLSAAVGLRQTGRVVLAELMGIEGGELPPELELSPLDGEMDEEMAIPDAEEWIVRALHDRPDLDQLRYQLESAEEQVRAARGLFSPAVVVSGSWGFDRGSNLAYSVEDQSSAAGVEFRWELFTGGARVAQVREAEALRAEAAAQLQRLRLSVQAEVRQAIIDLRDAQDQISLTREAVAVATENRRVIQAAYLAGREPLTRLNEAQRDFIAADADLALARIRLREAWSDLQAAAATYKSGSAESSKSVDVEN